MLMLMWKTIEKISLLISHNAAAAPQATVPRSIKYNQTAPLSFLNERQPLQPVQQGVNPPSLVQWLHCKQSSA